MPTTATQPVRVFISHSHDDNPACAPLLAALTALGVDYWFDTERLDAGTNLSTRIQAAITERDYFIRVCSAAVQRNPYWVDLETGAFRASQAQASKAGRPHQRVLIPFILDSGYSVQPFEQAVLYIDAAHEPVAIWTQQLRRALGLGDAATAPHTTGADQHRAPTSGATRVVDWRHGAGDHTTISAALAAAQPGERILIRRGVYTERLTIDKPLELVGDGDRDDVTIEASDASVIRWSAANGLIANLTLRQLGGTYYCVDISQGAPDLEDSSLSSEGRACIGIHGVGARPRVRRNRIHDSRQGGVFVYEQGQGLIEDNDIFANAVAGIYINGKGSAPTVRRNCIHDGKERGVLVYKQGQGLIEDNDIFANALSGVEIKEEGAPTVRRNRIHDGRQYGVSVWEQGQGLIEDNNIFANTFGGIVISGATTARYGTPIVRRNRINKNARQGIYVFANGGGVFELNDLRDNTQGAWFISDDSKANVTRRDNQE